MASANPFTLAADDNPKLLPLLRSEPNLASTQDAHGYSLLHAAVSYNHLNLLRTLVSEFHVSPNMTDEDGETPLFVAETVEAARMLLEEAKIDPAVVNAEGMTAEQKILTEGDYTAVADYLKESRLRADPVAPGAPVIADGIGHLPPLPPNVRLQVGTLEDEESLGEVADPELRQRIEQLAAKEDFQGEDGQRQLRELITDAVRGADSGERNVRPRTE